MGLATVLSDIAPLYERPSMDAARRDEALYGMSVQVVQASDDGWCYIRTELGGEGYTPASCLERREEVATAWRKYKKSLVLAPYIDVQSAVMPMAARIASLPRGGLLVPLGPEEMAEGWMKVGLANGAVGYTRASYLGDTIADWRALAPEDMRWNLVETAISYNGAALRAGGRSPLGIDGGGLISMTYYLNGVPVTREPYFKPGGSLQAVRPEAMDEGDIVYFTDGLGIYMGDGKLVYASAQPGREGVAVGSLRPKDPEFRPELAGGIVTVASLY